MVKLCFSEGHRQLIGGPPFQTVHSSPLSPGWLHPEDSKIAA